jgi:hypothetical protein
MRISRYYEILCSPLCVCARACASWVCARVCAYTDTDTDIKQCKCRKLGKLKFENDNLLIHLMRELFDHSPAILWLREMANNSL